MYNNNFMIWIFGETIIVAYVESEQVKTRNKITARTETYFYWAPTRYLSPRQIFLFVVKSTRLKWISVWGFLPTFFLLLTLAKQAPCQWTGKNYEERTKMKSQLNKWTKKCRWIENSCSTKFISDINVFIVWKGEWNI